MTARAVAETLGGKKVLKRQVRSDLDLLAAIERSLPTRAIEEVLRSGLFEPGEVLRARRPAPDARRLNSSNRNSESTTSCSLIQCSRAIALGGRLPPTTASVSILRTASCSPYSAWKCGGGWSPKYSLTTMP